MASEQMEYIDFTTSIVYTMDKAILKGRHVMLHYMPMPQALDLVFYADTVGVFIFVAMCSDAEIYCDVLRFLYPKENTDCTMSLCKSETLMYQRFHGYFVPLCSPLAVLTFPFILIYFTSKFTRPDPRPEQERFQ